MPELLSGEYFSDSSSDSGSDWDQQGQQDTDVPHMNTRSRRNQGLEQATRMQARRLNQRFTPEEDRVVDIGDISCVFMHTDQLDIVIMVLRGFLVECILKVKPEWYKYVSYNKKGDKLLYVRLNCGLYSCINSGLLF